VDAGQALTRQAELLQLLHQPVEHDLSEPFPIQVQPPVQAGPDAFRADQAEDTIWSTE
jgi:hypothetical protein